MSAERNLHGDAIVAFLVAMDSHAKTEIAAIEDPVIARRVRALWHEMLPDTITLTAHIYYRPLP